MYFREIETSAKAMRQHNDNNKKNAATRLKLVATKKKLKKGTK